MLTNEMGNYFEDFKINEIMYHSLSKTIFESDNNLFCLLTMNQHPLHTNLHYAEKEYYGKPLVVGTLVFSLVVGLTVQDISGKAIANLNFENIEHLSPTFINDTIYAKSKIIDLWPSKTRSDRGIVYVETTGYNQNNIDVLKFRRKVLLKKGANDE